MSTNMIKKDDRHMASQMMTTDPKTDMPALTSLLYNVCGSDQTKFEEACRLLDLFMDKAQEQNKWK